MLNQKFFIEDTELATLANEAMLGSPKAALKLSLYYQLYVFDHEKGLYWMQIAAENGDSGAQYNYAMLLYHDKSNEMSFIRALYWLRKAAEAGDPMAIEKLEWLYYQP